jgi:hypothetical protein
MKRPYTGNKDGAAAGEHPQLTALMKELFKAYSPALWNNGSWGVRNMRGKESLSVHATGRAADISWRNMGDKKRGVAKGGRKYAMEAMEYLIKHADALGIEMIRFMVRRMEIGFMWKLMARNRLSRLRLYLHRIHLRR